MFPSRILPTKEKVQDSSGGIDPVKTVSTPMLALSSLKFYQR